MIVGRQAVLKTGLTCPYCGGHWVRPHGNRIYVCENLQCPGGTAPVDSPGSHASVLAVTALTGVYLTSWPVGALMDKMRRSEPGVMIQSFLTLDPRPALKQVGVKK